MAEKLSYVSYPSPNFNERARAVDTIVLHYTAGDLKQSLTHLCNPAGAQRVSAHYVVDRNGTIYRLVDESCRAWHAGTGLWQGQDDINSGSIGIEIVNLGRRADGTLEPYPEKQIVAVIALCKDIQTRHRIRHVLGHSDFGLGRKVDPGELFPWKRLAEAGVGLWTDDLLRPKLSARAMLEAIGYDVKDIAQATAAFQRHYYPDGLLGQGHCTLQRLAAVYRLVTTAPIKSKTLPRGG